MSYLALAFRPAVVVDDISQSLVPAASVFLLDPSLSGQNISITCCIENLALHPVVVHDEPLFPNRLVHSWHVGTLLVGRTFPSGHLNSQRAPLCFFLVCNSQFVLQVPFEQGTPFPAVPDIFAMEWSRHIFCLFYNVQFT